MKTVLLILLLLSTQISFGQNTLNEYEKGEYENIVSRSSYIQENGSLNEKWLLAKVYGKLGRQNDYFNSIKIIKELNTESSEIVYHTEISRYYQQMLFIDSCLYHADLSLKTLENSGSSDSAIISAVYCQYANAMRNGGRYHQVINKAGANFSAMKNRCDFLLSYFNKALKYTNTENIRADIVRNIGTMYSDAAAAYSSKGGEYIYFAEKSIGYLEEGLKIETSPADKAMGHALIGLNQFYITEYDKADKSFQNALELTREKQSVIYPKQFILITDWWGINCENLYELTKDEKHLNQANSIYRENLKVWFNQKDRFNINDAYHNSAVNRLVYNNLKLFELSEDSAYLHQAFQFTEMSKYPAFYDSTNTIKKIQQSIPANTAYVSYVSISRPWRNVAFVITTDEFQVRCSKEHPVELDNKKLSYLYDFSDLKPFKKWSYTFYEKYFQPTDSLLKSKSINRVVVSNSDMMSMLNLDVLVSDTTGNSWKSLNYLFHQYQFSYALCAGSYFNSKPFKHELKLGLSLGEYKDEPSLRFSKKLASTLEKQYQFQYKEIIENISNYDVSLLLSHGNSSYHNSTASVKLNSENSLSTSTIESLDLSNELVIFSACNTNASQQYFSQGAIGNFSLAFRKAGSKSVLTTSWSIDDKSNAFIIEKFIHYLSEGLPKNEALWQAKKEYWVQSEQDEDFKPLYWAPYILTGNIKPLNIQKKSLTPAFNYYWLLLLLLLPLGVLIKNRFF
ncbi:MAG: CHAT domain-containing protein [Crocinitomicaceae bacterium]